MKGCGSSGGGAEWDINDATVPAIKDYDRFQEWPDGHCRYVYVDICEPARRHTSGKS